MRRIFALALVSAAAGLGACGGDTSVTDAREERRAPERVHAKTAEILAPDAPETVTVDDIRLEKSPRGKSLIVVWNATGPQGKFVCNADQRVDFPVCNKVN